MTMRSFFASWGMPDLAPLGNGALPLRSLRNMGVFRSRGQKNQSVLSSPIFKRKSVLQTTSSRHGILSVLSSRPSQRLASKKKWLQETLVSTATTPQRKAVVPAKDVILALEKGAAAGGADPPRKGQVAREAIDAFILGMVRFQVGSSARFNDLQHTSPSTMKITSNTIEMMDGLAD